MPALGLQPLGLGSLGTGYQPSGGGVLAVALSSTMQALASTGLIAQAVTSLSLRSTGISFSSTQVGATARLSTSMRTISRVTLLNWGLLRPLMVSIAAISRVTVGASYKAAFRWHTQGLIQIRAGTRARVLLALRVQSISNVQGVLRGVTSVVVRIFGLSWIKTKIIQGGIPLPAQCVVSDHELYSVIVADFALYDVAATDRALYNVAVSDEVANA